MRAKHIHGIAFLAGLVFLCGVAVGQSRAQTPVWIDSQGYAWGIVPGSGTPAYPDFLVPTAATTALQPTPAPLGNHASAANGTQRDAASPNQSALDVTDPGVTANTGRWTYFFDAIYWCPRNQEVSFGVPADGPIDFGRVPVQRGETVVAEMGYEFGYRLGFGMPLSEWSQIRVTGTWLEGDDETNGSTAPPYVMWPMTVHPQLDLADRQFLQASAEYRFDLELFDVDWVRVITVGPCHEVDLVLGARYAGLTHQFGAAYTGNIIDLVGAGVEFQGGGIRVGLDGEWFDPCRIWLVYAKGTASFVAGQFECEYYHYNNLGQDLARTRWEAGRLVSILDLEIGAGCQLFNRNIRLTAGYMVSGWHNVITVPEYIDSVRANSYTGMGDFITFDGFVGRVDFRF